MWLQSFIKHGTIPMENNFYLRTYAEHLVSPEQQRIGVFLKKKISKIKEETI